MEGAKSRTFEGSGIGLAIVHDMVMIHSGKIMAENIEGKEVPLFNSFAV